MKQEILIWQIQNANFQRNNFLCHITFLDVIMNFFSAFFFSTNMFSFLARRKKNFLSQEEILATRKKMFCYSRKSFFAS